MFVLEVGSIQKWVTVLKNGIKKVYLDAIKQKKTEARKQKTRFIKKLSIKRLKHYHRYL